MPFRRVTLTILLVVSTLLAGCESSNDGTLKREFVVMETTAGTIEIELYPQAAPVSVRNILRYVDAGAFDDGRIWRVVNPDNDTNPSVITVVQGSAREGFELFPPIQHETTQLTKLTHNDGALSLARTEPGTADAEFFISIGDNPSLDFGGARNSDGQGFAVFGRVTEGMDVVRRINVEATVDDPDAGYFRGQRLIAPVVIKRVFRRG